jgi:predicted 3-demethylubiquinone-9 3-methyltransferase (glyoxalase superfamily)
MQKITNHLWFDTEAKEAAEFYVNVFGGDSKVKSVNQIHDTPSGDVDIVDINLLGSEFTLISAGPLFKFNPSISFLIAVKTPAEAEALWAKLSPGGKVLMELTKYPFSEKYGWIQDKYGLSWQIMAFGEMPITQKITPSLMFTKENVGKAEEAINFYTSIFKNSKIENIMRYGEGQQSEKAEHIAHASFTLEEQFFAAMESAQEHKFNFNEAISFIVHCDTQEEIDYYWGKLSAVPESEQCGWLKDQYGVSWQIVPKAMDEMMKTKDQKKLNAVTQAFLKMKKFDIAELERVYNAN